MAIFGQYTGARVNPLPSGFMGAAMTNAANIQRGLGEAGDTIGRALESYGKSKQERDLLLGDLDAIKNIVASDQEHYRDVATSEDNVKKYGKAQDMSLSQLRAFVGGLRSQMAEVDNRQARQYRGMQIEQMQNQLDDRAAYQHALRQKIDPNISKTVTQFASKGTGIDIGPEGTEESELFKYNQVHGMAPAGMRKNYPPLVSGESNEASADDLKRHAIYHGEKIGGDILDALNVYGKAAKQVAGQVGQPSSTPEPSNEIPLYAPPGLGGRPKGHPMTEGVVAHSGLPALFPYTTINGKMPIDPTLAPLNKWTDEYHRGTMPQDAFTVRSDGTKTIGDLVASLAKDEGVQVDGSRFWELNPHLEIYRAKEMQDRPVLDGMQVLIDPVGKGDNAPRQIMEDASKRAAAKMVGPQDQGWIEDLAKRMGRPTVQVQETSKRIQEYIKQNYPTAYKVIPMGAMREAVVDGLNSLSRDDMNVLIDSALKPALAGGPGIRDAAANIVNQLAGRNEQVRQAVTSDNEGPLSSIRKGIDATGREATRFVADLSTKVGSVTPKLKTREIWEAEQHEVVRPKTWKEAHREMLNGLNTAGMELSPSVVKSLEEHAKSHYEEEPTETEFRLMSVNGAEGIGMVQKFVDGKPVGEAKQITSSELDREYKVASFGPNAFAFDKQDAKELRTQIADTKFAFQVIDDLIKISEQGAESLSPTQRRKSGQDATVLMGRLRLSLVGPGAVSEAEWELMREAIPGVGKVFSFERAERAALRNLRNRLRQVINQQAEAKIEGYGKTVAAPAWLAGDSPNGAGTTRNYTNDPRLAR